MRPFSSPQSLFDWLDAAVLADSTPLQARARKFAVDMLLYEGIQWLAGSSDAGASRIGRHIANENPDSAQLRVTVNGITTLVQRVAAQTFPNSIEVEGLPRSHSVDIESESAAQVCETVANAVLGKGDYLSVHRRANLRRSILGCYGVGLGLVEQDREISVRGRDVKARDRQYRFFTFDPTKLVLDPAVDEPDLHNHEFVIYRDVKTVEEIEREYGEKLDRDQCKTIGELAPLYLELSRMTDGRLFGYHRMYSKSKGALVYQIHCKDDAGFFSRMYVVVDPLYERGKRWVNEDDPSTPFGGSGLPLMLLHGNMRSESMWPISDVSMMRDAQHLKNIVWSFMLRHMQASAGSKVFMDIRSLPGGTTPEDFARSWTNRPYGVTFYDSSKAPNGRVLGPPQIASMPVFPAGVLDVLTHFDAEMRQNVGRVDVTQGAVKSHVPDSSFQTALNQANMTLDVRVREDTERVERFSEMVLGTVIASVKRGDPSTLAMLTTEGFGAEEIEALLAADESNPPVRLVVRESSVRSRSHETRARQISEAVASQAIDPFEARMIMARELDIPMSDGDRRHVIAARRAAVRVLAGEQWEPIPLGAYARVYVDAFRDAMVSRQARLDPEAKERLIAAIDAQEQYEMARAMAMQPPAPEQGAPAGQPAPMADPAMQTPLTVDAVLGAPSLAAG